MRRGEANVGDKKGYDRCFQTECDSKGLNRRLLSGGELSYPENLEWFDNIQSAPGNLFATALMALPSPKKNSDRLLSVEVGRGQPEAHARLHRWARG
jgi:hypothetical protein